MTTACPVCVIRFTDHLTVKANTYATPKTWQFASSTICLNSTTNSFVIEFRRVKRKTFCSEMFAFGEKEEGECNSRVPSLSVKTQHYPIIFVFISRSICVAQIFIEDPERGLLLLLRTWLKGPEEQVYKERRWEKSARHAAISIWISLCETPLTDRLLQTLSLLWSLAFFSMSIVFSWDKIIVIWLQRRGIEEKNAFLLIIRRRIGFG